MVGEKAMTPDRLDPVIREYSAAAKDYDKKWSFYVDSTTRETMQRLAMAGTERVLDVGCGTGELLARIAAKYPAARLAGLDPVPEMLEVAKGKLSQGVDLRVGWANELPWQDKSFDLVVSCNMFHYITHPVAAIREMERVLRPGGRIVITDWCDDYVACRLCNAYLRLTSKAHYRTYRQAECFLAKQGRSLSGPRRAIQNKLVVGANDRRRPQAGVIRSPVTRKRSGPMKSIVAVLLCLMSRGAFAQTHQPYAGQSGREIKALSGEEVEQYLSGAGMGFAKAAELNHYPGPMHALELADQLGLKADQIQAVERLMSEHKAEARIIGTRLVESERALDTLFKRTDADQHSLAEAVQRVASLQGQYRLSHLETHRKMKSLLSDEQIATYDVLRGYALGGEATHRRMH